MLRGQIIHNSFEEDRNCVLHLLYDFVRHNIPFIFVDISYQDQPIMLKIQ